jgi:hypothetical protein
MPHCAASASIHLLVFPHVLLLTSWFCQTAQRVLLFTFWFCHTCFYSPVGFATLHSMLDFCELVDVEWGPRRESIDVVLRDDVAYNFRSDVCGGQPDTQLADRQKQTAREPDIQTDEQTARQQTA